jgi:hypothetical protein
LSLVPSLMFNKSYGHLGIWKCMTRGGSLNQKDIRSFLWLLSTVITFLESVNKQVIPSIETGKWRFAITFFALVTFFALEVCVDFFLTSLFLLVWYILYSFCQSSSNYMLKGNFLFILRNAMVINSNFPQPSQFIII